MMWEKIKPYLLYFSIGLNLAFVLFIGFYLGPWSGRGSHRRTDRPDPRRFLKEELELTAEQWDEIEPRMEKFKQKAQEVRAEISRQRRKKLDLLLADRPDTPAIEESRRQLREARENWRDLSSQHFSEMRDILDEEQRRRLRSRFSELSRPDTPPVNHAR